MLDILVIMTDSLGDIMGSRNYSEPPEIQKIKDFVYQEVQLIPSVSVTKTSFIVSVPSAAAAGNLRFKLFQLQRQLGNERKIILKIG